MNHLSKSTILPLTLLLGGVAHAETIFDIDYTAGESYADGKLQFQNGWLGQASAQVDSTGTGTVSSVGGPFDRNLHGTGIRGGVGGVPTTEGTFQQFEGIRITFKYQFTLSGDGGRELAAAGIAPTGPNMANGFNANPTQGFNIR